MQLVASMYMTNKTKKHKQCLLLVKLLYLNNIFPYVSYFYKTQDKKVSHWDYI